MTKSCKSLVASDIFQNTDQLKRGDCVLQAFLLYYSVWALRSSLRICRRFSQVFLLMSTFLYEKPLQLVYQLYLKYWARKRLQMLRYPHTTINTCAVLSPVNVFRTSNGGAAIFQLSYSSAHPYVGRVYSIIARLQLRSERCANR